MSSLSQRKYDEHETVPNFDPVDEVYWNQGSPVTQSRWYDNFVISTEPIGPVVCPTNPTVIKTPYRGPGRAGAGQV